MGMLLVSLIWGVNFSMMKFALGSLTPFALTAIRFLLASVVLWMVARWLEPDARVPARVGWALAGLGVVGNTLYQMGFINGLARTTAGNSSLLIASTPLMTAVVGAALGAERVTRAVAAAILIGTTGLVLVVVGHGEGLSFSTTTLPGDVMTLSAVFCWALFSHGARRVGAAVSPLQVAVYTTLGGTPGLVVAGLSDLGRLDWGAVSLATWGAVLYSAVLSIVFCYVVWNHSLSRIGANRTAIYGITTPLFALTAAALMLGERPTAGQLVGAALILASVAVNIAAHWRTAEKTIPISE